MLPIPWYKYQMLKFAFKFISTEIEISIFIEILRKVGFLYCSIFLCKYKPTQNTDKCKMYNTQRFL